MTPRRLGLLLSLTGPAFSAIAAAEPLPAGAAPGSPTPPVDAAPPAAAAPAPAEPSAATGVQGGAEPAGPPGLVTGPPEEPPPIINIAQPPLPPLEPKSRHYHDGFYLRISAGIGTLNIASSADRSDAQSTVSGWGPTFDLMMGGTPSPGLVIGGGVLYQSAFDPSTSYDGPSLPGITRGSANYVTAGLLGPMIDAFPNPSGGFHFGGLVGLARLGLQDAEGNASVGLGLSAWIGHMWWASSQWSVGGLLRLTAIGTGRTVGRQPDQHDVADAALAFTAMFSSAFH